MYHFTFVLKYLTPKFLDTLPRIAEGIEEVAAIFVHSIENATRYRGGAAPHE